MNNEELLACVRMRTVLDLAELFDIKCICTFFPVDLQTLLMAKEKMNL